jgi:hypothetical protein
MLFIFRDVYFAIDHEPRSLRLQSAVREDGDGADWTWSGTISNFLSSLQKMKKS